MSNQKECECGLEDIYVMWKKRLRHLWRCGAFNSFQSDDSTAFFHHHARRHSPTSLLCFYKAWPTDPIGNSQEPRLHATIAMLGNVSSAQLLFRVRVISWKKDYLGCMTSYGKEEDAVTTYQERLGSYLKKVLQRIKNVLKVT